MTRTPKWSVTQEISQAHLTQVFSGGACNILSAGGELLRNKERDAINDWLSEKNIIFFDPQIHPDTHGVEYDYAVHQPLEVAARSAAQINLYEVSPLTFSGITSLEIASDHFRWHEPMVIYYSDGDEKEDRIPVHSQKGNPLFQPLGIKNSEQAARSHYREFIKNANNMRKYLMHFARETDTLTVTFDEATRPGDMVISPNRMHATDIFEAVVRACAGERVFVNFTGGKTKRDKKGNPLFSAPEDPAETQLHALLDQYVDEGSALRRRIAELVEISVFLRVVYTQSSAILALEELLRVKKVLS